MNAILKKEVTKKEKENKTDTDKKIFVKNWRKQATFTTFFGLSKFHSFLRESEKYCVLPISLLITNTNYQYCGISV